MRRVRTNPFRLSMALCTLLCVSLACCHKAPPHSVTLTWEASPAVPGVFVAGYNVYRSTTSGGQFVKIASRVPGPPYEDRLVGSGRTYFYVVTCLDQAGRESRFSAEARATIP
jgi:fibronectin type 3 domain-containing protein